MVEKKQLLEESREYSARKCIYGLWIIPERFW